MAETSIAYQDIDPISYWTEKRDRKTFVVHLPEFKKEQLKVQIAPRGIVRILGEMPAAAGNTRVRFHKEYPIPDGVDASRLSARFVGEYLYVDHPKVEKQEKPDAKAATDATPTPHSQPPQHERGAAHQRAGRKSEGPKPSSERASRSAGNGAKDSMSYEQVLGVLDGLFVEVKKRRKLAAALTVAAALVLLLGLYGASKAFRS